MPNPRPIKPLSYYSNAPFITNTLKRHIFAATQCFLNGENPIFALAGLTVLGLSKPLDTILFNPDIKKAVVVISSVVDVDSLKRTKNPSIFITINIYINAFIYRVTPRNENENNKLTIENRKAFSEIINIFNQLSKDTSIEQSFRTDYVTPLCHKLDQAFSNNILPSLDAGDDLEEKDELIPEPVLSIKNQKFDLTATLGKLNTNSDEALSKLFELVNQLCDNSQFNEAFFVIQKMVRVDQFDFWSNSNLLVVDHFIAKLLQQVKQNTNPDYVLFALQALTEFLQPTQYKNTRQTARAFICRVDAQLFDVLIKTFKPTTDSTIAALSSLFEILLQPDSPSTHNDILDRELTIFSIHINTKIKKLKIDSLSKFSLGLGILGALSAGVALLLLFVFATTLFNPWILLFVSTPIMILGVAGFVGLKFWNSTTNVVDKNKSEEKLRTELQWAENNFSRISTMGPLIKTNLENWLHSYGIKSRRHSTLIKVLSQYSRLIDEINIERDKKAFEQCFGNFEMIEQLSDVIGPRKTIDILLQQSNAVFLEFLK